MKKPEAGPVLIDKDGKKIDLSDFMLDNKDANAASDELAVKEAVASGKFTEKEARKLFIG